MGVVLHVRTGTGAVPTVDGGRACEGCSGGEDEAAVGCGVIRAIPLIRDNPRFRHGRAVMGRYFILVLKWIWAFHGATAV